MCWRGLKAEDLENISIESVLDQVAIPTKIINDFFRKPVNTVPTKKSTSNEHLESSTVHYENSNGFVPLIVSTQSYETKHRRRNSTSSVSATTDQLTTKSKAIEDDPVFSTEARIFLNLPNPGENRRSFQAENNQDEFELLKVSNGTPAVANYDSFYDQSKDIFKSDSSHLDKTSKRPLRNKDRDRGKRIQNYLGIYDAANEHDEQYVQHEDAEQKKHVYQQEKSKNHYKQNHTVTYRSQKAILPRTNYASMTTPNSNLKVHTTNLEKTEEHKFKIPIMVEPSEYKVDMRFNGQSVQSVVSTTNPHVDMKDQMDSVDHEASEQFSQRNEGTSRNYESAYSRDSEENLDYMDEMGKPRRIQKTSKRRPYFDSSRKLPKEHRETYDDLYDDNGRKRPKSKSRHRQRQKSVEVINDDEQYDNEGDNVEENINESGQQNFNEGNTWNQVTPNVEVSHSNGFEINQIEKPKLHVVPVNILSNFDHATALDNSQGFDITNAMFTGFVHEGPLVSTAAPLLSSPPNFIDKNFPSSTPKSQLLVSTPVPDVIVGQSSVNNPVQAVFMPNKLHQNMLNHYIQSTVSPTVFAVNPRPGYSASTTIGPNLQQMLNQVQASFPMNQQLINPQPTRQPFTNLQQPAQSSTNNQFYVNNNGLQGQNSYSFQKTQSTTSRPNTDRDDTHKKKKFDVDNNSQYLASASLSVGRGAHRHSNNNENHNNNYKGNVNEDHNSNVQSNQEISRQNLNTFAQPTMVPAILHTGIGLISNQNPQLLQNSLFLTNAQQNILENSMKQLQYNLQNNRYQLAGLPSLDSVGGASNNINAINSLFNPIQKAQLPILGAKNVEIINPNLNANAYAVNQIPATLVTTPIPIFTSTGFVTPKTFSTTTQEPLVSVPNFVNSLTEIGTKKPTNYETLNLNSFFNLQGSDRPLFNPINFVPNYDLIKSQSILNSNVIPNQQFSQHNLNLVPVLPGGNFYKHTQGSQIDLTNKPHHSSDLEKFAEEMFKESLRTMYNTQKWNNDPRSPGNISLVDNSDFAKLRNELFRIKSKTRDSNVPKDVLEAHYTENKIRTVRPGNGNRPDSSNEQSYKNDHKTHSGPRHHPHHHRNKPEINDYLTPPRINSFISKSPFHDRPPKKRPGHGPRPNFHEPSRPRPRQGVASPKPKTSDAQASSIVDYRFPVQPNQDKSHYSQADYRGSQSYNYPTFTTSFPESDQFKSSGEYRSSERDYYDINHQRTHNLMGLLMKNKQLPPGMPENVHNDRQMIGQLFDEENRRTQSQAYQDVFKSFQKKSDTGYRPIALSRISRRTYPRTDHKS